MMICKSLLKFMFNHKFLVLYLIDLNDLKLKNLYNPRQIIVEIFHNQINDNLLLFVKLPKFILIRKYLLNIFVGYLK